MFFVSQVDRILFRSKARLYFSPIVLHGRQSICPFTVVVDVLDRFGIENKRFLRCPEDLERFESTKNKDEH